VRVTKEEFEDIGRGAFPGLLGIVVEEVGEGAVSLRMPVRPDHLAPNGFLHAGAVVGLADTACGYGCVASLPEGAVGFTTIELKANFLGTARDGELTCRATLSHGGRTTQVWDAAVNDGRGRTIALFRCTQLVLAARPDE
jgi:1,4-dihydroxy-2-naphthoyl-CoA hydrolase